jgi:hypothetical protein
VHENSSEALDGSRSTNFPVMDLIDMTLLLEITAKFRPSPIDSRNSLIAVMTVFLSIFSSSN